MASSSCSSSSSSSSSSRRIGVGVLGCTGVVGQKFIQLLENHSQFQLVAVGASERSADKLYKDIAWKLPTPIPACAASLTILPCLPSAFIDAGVEVVFSALDASVAGEIEESMAKAGLKVFSNARNYRYDNTVPILIPHVNADHIDVIPVQQKEKGFTASLPNSQFKGGYIVTNANCSSTGLVVALKPLIDRYGIDKLFVVTMQAISGGGYPGVSALDITDNIVPFISGEEPKMELEPLKILGKLSAGGAGAGTNGSAFDYQKFDISAHCNRVPVIDGHTECVSIKLSKQPSSIEEVNELFENYLSEAQRLKLPSAPRQPIIVHRSDNRPQPRLDRDAGNGFVVSIGRVRKCNLFDIKFTLLSHNVVIGAAGGSIQNAELALAKGYI